MRTVRVSRRDWIAGATAALVAPAAFAAAPRGDAVLRFHHLHTGERLEAAYRRGGRLQRPALAAIDHLLRDFRTGEVHAIDASLLDLLAGLGTRLDTRAPFEVISGYRSPRTNRMLAAAGHGVARRSLHMHGLAIDVRLPGRRLEVLRDAARGMRAGGVGFYPKPGFVHVDVGRVRFW